MKILFIFLLVLSVSILFSQSPHLDVEGDVKIRGDIDIHNVEDTTTLIIGRGAGANFVQSPLSSSTSVFVGINAGHMTTTGRWNSFFGADAGYSNTTARTNCFFGNEAGYLTNANANSFFGYHAGYTCSSGISNSFFGAHAGASNNDGENNTFIGALSGQGNVTFSGIVDKSIALGYNAKVSCSNCAVIGGTDADAVKLGIGVDSPTTVLMLLEPGAVDPVGITQNLLGSVSTMELTTRDDSNIQTTRVLLRGGQDAADIEFYRGGRSNELLTMFIEGSNGRVGINTNAPTEKLDVDGNARFRSVGSGAFMSELNLTSDGTLTTTTSDVRLKTDIQTLDQALAKTLALRGVNYHWKSDTAQNDRIGLIAQEVEEVVPEVVFTNPADGYKGVRYQELCALLIEAVKEQQEEIRTMEEKYRQLESDLAIVKEQLNQLAGLQVNQDFDSGK